MAPRKEVGSAELLRIKRLMRLMSEALALAQTLLSERLEHEESAVLQKKMRPVTTQPPSADILASIQDIAIAFGEQLSHPDRKFSECRRDLVKARIHHRIHRAGRAGAAILLRMIEQPDVFIDQKNLATSAGVASKSPNVVKVYICQLRKGLEEQGLPADMIETGRRSYRLRSDAIPQIMEMVTRP